MNPKQTVEIPSLDSHRSSQAPTLRFSEASILERFMFQRIAPELLSNKGRLTALILYVSVAIFAVYAGLMRLKTDFDFTTLLTEDSNLENYFTLYQ